MNAAILSAVRRYLDDIEDVTVSTAATVGQFTQAQQRFGRKLLGLGTER